jgi:mono/diheme cytochrome c family protein/plastocyanin
MRKEWLARTFIILLLVAAIGIPIIGWRYRSRGIVIHAHMAETGGWTPENLTVSVGQPLHLRLTSDDVTHSFAIGQSDRPQVDVIPGEMTNVTLVFDQPGKYTFYCTRWCSVNHWRMRGTIEVTGPTTTPQTAQPPLYVSLGLDIDAPHRAALVPVEKPSALRGSFAKQIVPGTYLTRDYYLAHAPVELWKALREELSLQALTNQDLWDVVAWVWQTNASSQALQEGEKLYTANCAACHGEQGEGNGVFAEQLPKSQNPAEMPMADKPGKPANFTDPDTMLSASPAHLQGKILRGGMGTSMPYWGPIFNDEQTWALVAYLWSFQFDLKPQP